MKTYRKGPIRALADEYEKVLNEFKAFLVTIPHETFIQVNDPDSKNLKSASAIAAHVVYAGYRYANYIRQRFGNETMQHTVEIASTKEAITHLDEMFAYTLNTFEDLWPLTNEDLWNTIIKTSWTTYDLEALLEHAIVHILRHRRQIEKTIY